MKKILVILLLACCLLTGCTKENKKINLNVVADDLIENIEFEDQLTKLNNKMTMKLFGINNFKEAIVYTSSGATAEEIALFEFPDKKDVEVAYEKVQNRVEKQREDYASYLPKELVKLDQAIIIKYRNYIVLCVTSDPSADKIIGKYFS